VDNQVRTSGLRSSERPIVTVKEVMRDSKTGRGRPCRRASEIMIGIPDARFSATS